MLTTDILDYLNQHGLFLIFIILFLEALNLTGIPAIVILPTIGFFTEQTSYSFLSIWIITVIGSVCGAILYYMISRKFGRLLFNFFYTKFPMTQKGLNKATELSQRYGAMTCFIGRILPSVRTFISLMAGVFEIPFRTYLLYSSGGIMIWNLITLLIGYLPTIFS